MNTPHINPGPHRAAFTLIELMVTMSILAILVAFIASMINATQITTRASSRMTVTDADARVALDRIGRDLEGLVCRTDADFWACNPVGGQSGLAEVNSGNTLALFLSEVTSDNSNSPSGGNRNISVISYQVAASANNTGAGNASLPCLLRAGKAVGLSGSDSHVVGLKPNGLPIRFNDTGAPAFPANVLPNNSAGNSDFDVLASGVIRMVIGFQLYPDNKPVVLDSAAGQVSIDNAQGQLVYSPPVRQLTPTGGGAPVNYIDLTRISSIVAGIVVIDHTVLKLLSPDQVNLIAKAFSVPSMNSLPIPAWQAALNSIAQSLRGSIPLAALQSIHVYERVYPVTLRGQVKP